MPSAGNPSNNRWDKASFRTKPLNPNYLRRCKCHDYTRPARYMITLHKSPQTPILSAVSGDPRISDPMDSNFPKVTLLPTGKIFMQALKQWTERFKMIEVIRVVVMPDHLHLCMEVRDWLNNGLSRVIASLMGLTTSLYYESLPLDNCPPEKPRFFSKGFNDSIAFNDERWEKQLAYVDDNPRRLLIKRLYPDYFRMKWLLIVNGKEFVAMGNIFLLKMPEIKVVRFSRKFSKEQFERYVHQWKISIENGGVLISPFIHSKENAMKKLAYDQGGLVIRICENGFSDRFAPTGGEFSVMAEGRLLLIGPAHHETQKTDMTYRRAQELNKIAETIATHPNLRLRPLQPK